MRLLKSLSIDESQMKVNRKMLQEHTSGKNWFSSKSNKSSSELPSATRPEQKYAYGQKAPSNGKETKGTFELLKLNFYR